jgi:hypothetical protein
MKTTVSGAEERRSKNVESPIIFIDAENNGRRTQGFHKRETCDDKYLAQSSVHRRNFRQHDLAAADDATG